MGRMVTCLVAGKGGIMIRVVLRGATAATMVVCALAPLTVVAQAWPTKPVKFVVPFPPGGSVDPLARVLGARLADSLGQQFIVENKTGAGGPMMTDVMGSQIDLGIASVAALSANVKGGKLRALAVTADKRSHVMPDVPTLAEQGFPGFSAFAWWGIFAPSGTPKPVLEKFHAELVKVLNQSDLRRQLTETLGMDLASSSPEALQKFLVGEINRWGNVVRSNSVRAD